MTLALIVKGFSSIIIQSLLIRELLIVFYGNELIFSLILAIWLISSALGATLLSPFFKKSQNSINLYCVFQILLSSLFFLSLILIRTSKIWLGVPLGEIFNLHQITLLITASLGLPAFLDGAMFRIGFGILAMLSHPQKPSLSRIYLLESSGALIGGLSLTFIMLQALNSFQIVFCIAGLNIFLAALLLNQGKNVIFKVLGWIILLNFAAAYPQGLMLQKKTIASQWPNKNILAYKNSVYGNIVAVKDRDQTTIFYDGLPAISLPISETYFTEDFVHLPLLAKDKTDNILFIGHAVGGLLREALKYPKTEIVYAEIDPLLIETIRAQHSEPSESELKDPRVHIQWSDGRNFIKQTKEKFGAVFVNTDIATSLSLNRYATREFFCEVRQTLSPGGIAVFKTWGSLAALSAELKNVNRLLLKTLESVFPFVETIPGDGFNIFIASGQQIILDPTLMSKNYENLSLKTSLINPSYLRLRLDPSARDWFYANLANAKNTIVINEDLKPTGLYAGLKLTYSQFSKKIPRLFTAFEKIKPLPITMIVILFFIGWRLVKPKTPRPALNFAIFSTGFFTMSMQIMILLLFQIFLGYLFQWLALLTASFMAGIALGAFYTDKAMKQLSTPKGVYRIEYIFGTLILLGLSAIIAIAGKHNVPALALGWLLAGLSFLSGVFLGVEIPAVYALRNISGESAGRNAGWIYCLDLSGACIGVLLTPLILIPSCGIIATSLILCLIKWGSAGNIAQTVDQNHSSK